MMFNILKKSNDIVHLSALEDFNEPYVELGQLIHQGTLHVSTIKGLRRVEKKRQVFLFTRCVLISKQREEKAGRTCYSFKQKLHLAVSKLCCLC